jgi:hypothetical protein
MRVSARKAAAARTFVTKPVYNAATNAKAAASLFRARPAPTLATAQVPVGSLPTVREYDLRSGEFTVAAAQEHCGTRACSSFAS